MNPRGFLTQRVPTETPPDDWSVTLEGNLSSAFTAAALCATDLRGAMVMTGSGWAPRPPDYGAYAVAKAGSPP
ncbi:MAG: hypothetical protein CM15mP103_08060 [Gammaproteobacteria bacterium]|nr:MAG: hypothetical protein CM15mP103_08060 [Gammaproteobacteria bacterium]